MFYCWQSWHRFYLAVFCLHQQHQSFSGSCHSPAEYISRTLRAARLSQIFVNLKPTFQTLLSTILKKMSSLARWPLEVFWKKTKNRIFWQRCWRWEEARAGEGGSQTRVGKVLQHKIFRTWHDPYLLLLDTGPHTGLWKFLCNLQHYPYIGNGKLNFCIVSSAIFTLWCSCSK